MLKRFKFLGFCLGLFLAFFVFANQAEAAALQVNPPGGSFDVGDTFEVVIDLSLSDESVDGVDALLFFDADLLQVEEIAAGDLFSSYPTNTYDNTQGTITISGVTQGSGSAVTSGGTMATITFLANAAGTSSLTFDFTSGSGTDSNVAESETGNDILESIVNGSYTISGSDSDSSSTDDDSDSGVGGSGTTTTTTTLDESTGLPVTAGSPYAVISLMVIGLTFLILGWQLHRKKIIGNVNQ